jgi:methylenetetrahydrofolate dehydrogenase (NADP+)/methenyltetrahydrofolate cyclohydrolase
MPKILDGKVVRDEILKKLKREIRISKRNPILAIIQIGNLKESIRYIEQKKIFAEKIGAKVDHIKLSSNTSLGELLNEIDKLNKKKSVSGIIVQLPLPNHLSVYPIVRSISPAKDVDGLNPLSPFTPATARGIVSLLDFYKIQISGKQIVVVGRSNLVGKPTALSLLARNATVTIAHSKTKNLKQITKQADILIVAIGKSQFINEKYVKKGQVVIDVGINFKKTALQEEITTNKKQELIGDVDFNRVKKIVKAISPVPGGVGAMTVASLFENLVEASRL